MAAAAEVPMTHNWSADTWDWPLERADGVIKVHNTGNKFEVGLAVGEFRPDEIKISVSGHDLIVRAHHENRTDHHGTIAREVNRVYKLPTDVNPATLKSHLNQHGTLLITADKH